MFWQQYKSIIQYNCESTANKQVNIDIQQYFKLQFDMYWYAD